MQYASLDIVKAEAHKNWINVSNVQWRVGRGISNPTGPSADRESPAPSVSDVAITRATDAVLNEAYPDEGQTVQIDDGSVKFLSDSVDVVDFCKTDKGKLEVYL
jgi:type VI secretion system secreted protein Hcp